MVYCNKCGEYSSAECYSCGMEDKISQLEKENLEMQAEIDKRDKIINQAKIIVDELNMDARESGYDWHSCDCEVFDKFLKELARNIEE